MKKPTAIILAAFLVVAAQFPIVLAHSQTTSLADPDQQQSVNGYVIENVNIIPMSRDNAIIPNANVVIQGEKITAINGPVPAEAQVIDGKGKWLIPGLIDMHVHNLADINLGESYPTKGISIPMDTQDFMLLYVANGVTTAFELSGRVEHFAQRNEVAKGAVFGPRVALAFLIDGGGSGNTANTPSDGRQTVRIAKAQGYEFIKVYSNLNEETYKAIIDEANKQGLKVIGHIPTAFVGHTADAFVPHFGMVAHAEEFSKQTETFTDDEARRFAAMAKANGTWVTPNLSNLVRIAAQARTLNAVSELASFKYVHPLMQSKWMTANQYNEGTNPRRVAYYDKLVDFHERLVKAMRDAGVPMVAGTDAGTSGIVWGFSLHDELQLLVDAGLTSEEAMLAATIQPARWLGIEDRTGSVETGKFADLVLLDANPFEDIANTRKIAGVFANGHWVSRNQIDAMLTVLAAKNARLENKLEWSRRREY